MPKQVLLILIVFCIFAIEVCCIYLEQKEKKETQKAFEKWLNDTSGCEGCPLKALKEIENRKGEAD